MVSIGFLLGVLAGQARWDQPDQAHTSGPALSVSCLEDEIVILRWDGDQHANPICWPIDDLWMLERIN